MYVASHLPHNHVAMKSQDLSNLLISSDSAIATVVSIRHAGIIIISLGLSVRKSLAGVIAGHRKK